MDVVLSILTSHRMDCFLYALRCLERHTDLSRFTAVYVLANEVAADHYAMIVNFARRHSNVEVWHAGPRGLLMAAGLQNRVVAAHPAAVHIKMDEDVFVGPRWFEALWHLYATTTDRNAVLFTPFIFNNDEGERRMRPFLEAHYGREYLDLNTAATGVPNNPVYAEWLWNKILRDDLPARLRRAMRDNPVQRLTGFLNINCILYDTRLSRRIFPLTTHDEPTINYAVTTGGYYGLMTAASQVFHYSFGAQQKHLDATIGLKGVAAGLFPDRG